MASTAPPVPQQLGVVSERWNVSEQCKIWIGTSKRTGVPPTQDSTAPTGILPPSDACRRWAVSKQTALALPALLAEALNQLSVGVDDVTADLQTFAETLHQGLPAWTPPKTRACSQESWSISGSEVSWIGGIGKRNPPSGGVELAHWIEVSLEAAPPPMEPDWK